MANSFQCISMAELFLLSHLSVLYTYKYILVFILLKKYEKMILEKYINF